MLRLTASRAVVRLQATSCALASATVTSRALASTTVTSRALASATVTSRAYVTPSTVTSPALVTPATATSLSSGLRFCNPLVPRVWRFAAPRQRESATAPPRQPLRVFCSWKKKDTRNIGGRANALIAAIRDVPDSKEDVYRALDAWAAFQLDFPLLAGVRMRSGRMAGLPAQLPSAGCEARSQDDAAGGPVEENTAARLPPAGREARVENHPARGPVEENTAGEEGEGGTDRWYGNTTSGALDAWAAFQLDFPLRAVKRSQGASNAARGPVEENTAGEEERVAQVDAGRQVEEDTAGEEGEVNTDRCNDRVEANAAGEGEHCCREGEGETTNCELLSLFPPPPPATCQMCT
ncbi:unnamed protein product [Closterium sp. NIES-54]